MRSEIADRIYNNVSPDSKVFVHLYADLLKRVHEILDEKGLTQEEKSCQWIKEYPESEITRWIEGTHDFSLRSLARLEAELGEVLLEVPLDRKKRTFPKEASNNMVTVAVSALTVNISSEPEKSKMDLKRRPLSKKT